MKAALLLLVLLVGYANAQNRAFEGSGGYHPKQIQTVAPFEMGGVTGRVQAFQRNPGARTKLTIELEGLGSLPGDEYGLYITDYPLNYVNGGNSPCSAASIGGIFDPEGNLGIVNYDELCRANHSFCAIGDLATRHGPLNSSHDGVPFSVRDYNLPLSGPNSIQERSVVLRRLDTGEALACSSNAIPSQTKILRAQFSNALSGDVYISVPQYNYQSLTLLEDTIIFADLERVDGGDPNSINQRWQLQRGFADASCNSLEPTLGQRAIPAGSTGCSQTNHLLCPLGDLTAKCGPVSIVDSRLREFCTDNQLALVPFSTLDQLVISVNQAPATGNPLGILDCAQLEEVFPAGGIVNFIGDGLYANIIFSQASPFSPTLYRPYVIGLNGRAADILVYDGPDCSNLGDVLDRPGRPSTGSAVTCDQVPVGELGTKFGGVRGESQLRTQGLSTCIPLFGPQSILGRPIVVTDTLGMSLGCGMVEELPNAPAVETYDVFDYLDLFKQMGK